MLARAVRVARIRGVEVRLDPSLVLLALLLAWLLWTRFGETYGGIVGAGMAATGSLLFFVSILVHELAHAFEAMHRDIEVKGITLLLFGGVTEMHTESQHPRDEFVIAAVGPYLSLVCAAGFHLTGVFATTWLSPSTAAPIAELALLLAYLNLLLAAFNLVPGAPLDGGRVLRAALWWLTGDRRRAVRGAARAGQGFGAAIVLFGVYEFAAGLQLAALGGLWWILIGAFLFHAARSELRRDHARAAMDGRTAGEILGILPPIVAPSDQLDLVTLPDGGADHVLVAHPDGTATGWIPASDLAALAELDGPGRTAGEIASPIDGLPGVEVDASLHEVVQGFADGARRLRLEDGGRTVAVLTERRTADALRSLDRDQRAGLRAGTRTGLRRRRVGA
jgi:Zn-dependent protease